MPSKFQEDAKNTAIEIQPLLDDLLKALIITAQEERNRLVTADKDFFDNQFLKLTSDNYLRARDAVRTLSDLAQNGMPTSKENAAPAADYINLLNFSFTNDPSDRRFDPLINFVIDHEKELLQATMASAKIWSGNHVDQLEHVKEAKAAIHDYDNRARACGFDDRTP